MLAEEGQHEAVQRILSALKPLLSKRGCFGVTRNSLQRLCRDADLDEMVRLGATRLLVQQAVPQIASLNAREAPARVSEAEFAPIAVVEGLAFYVLTVDQAERFAALRATLPMLDIDLEAVLAVGRH